MPSLLVPLFRVLFSFALTFGGWFEGAGDSMHAKRLRGKGVKPRKIWGGTHSLRGRSGLWSPRRPPFPKQAEKSQGAGWHPVSHSWPHPGQRDHKPQRPQITRQTISFPTVCGRPIPPQHLVQPHQMQNRSPKITPGALFRTPAMQGGGVFYVPPPRGQAVFEIFL